MVLNKVNSLLLFCVFQGRERILLTILHVWNLNLSDEFVGTMLPQLETIYLKLVLKGFLPCFHLNSLIKLPLNNFAILPFFERFQINLNYLYSILSVGNQFTQKLMLNNVRLIFNTFIGTGETSIAVRRSPLRSTIGRIMNLF